MKKAREIPEMSGWTDEKIDAWLETHDISDVLDKAVKQTKPVIRTSSGMPRISKETFLAIFSRYTDKKNEKGLPDWGKHLESVKKRLIEEDENLTQFLEAIVAKNFAKEHHNKAFECLIGMYAMIEHQVEANNLALQPIETKPDTIKR